MKQSVVADKSYKFAKNIVELYKQLTEIKKEFIMSKQLLKSGTSIGANIREALRGQSKKDFLAKMYVSIKETDETKYRLQLLYDTGYIDEVSYTLLGDCEEISKILNAIIKTTQYNINQSNKITT
ncbi:MULTISPECIES: four helix bundle protein [unclassified Clostridium]|uniref:four helix bundle protein n=1 Tax=unclassified Clostridium TaxID=2614128 RepID=UPI0002972707|nr:MULTISPECIES: four helix bundle protein [unclassified Clostridium]EKQ51169.1 MAG: TIGR02436 family protein [Clostridium sp. Maddingley MBC34-26]